MAGTAVSLFKQDQMPAHIAQFNDTEKNIQDKLTVPSLGYEGKVWSISLDGVKSKLMKKNEEGDEIPVPVFRAVILDFNQRRGRSYYEGAYNPDASSAPICWSEDGVKPHNSVQTKQADTCAACPHSVKGSKITEQGKEVSACSQHRMLALVPAQQLGFTPLRLKIAVTSDFDKNSPELAAQEWFAFSQYLDHLRSNGVNHTGVLVTKMKFDSNSAYPKVVFQADRWLTEDEFSIVKEVAKGEDVEKLLHQWTAAGVDGTAIPPKAEAADEDDDEVVLPGATQAPKAAPAAEAPRGRGRPPGATNKPKEAPPAVVVQPAAKAPPPPPEDDDEDMILPGQEATTAAKTAPSTGAAIPEDVAALLADWDD